MRVLSVIGLSEQETSSLSMTEISSVDAEHQKGGELTMTTSSSSSSPCSSRKSSLAMDGLKDWALHSLAMV